MRSRRSDADEGWLPAPSFPAWSGAVVPAQVYWPVGDSIEERPPSLARAAPTRVPASINVWNNRAIFFIVIRFTLHLGCGFGFGGFVRHFGSSFAGARVSAIWLAAEPRSKRTA